MFVLSLDNHPLGHHLAPLLRADSSVGLLSASHLRPAWPLPHVPLRLESITRPSSFPPFTLKTNQERIDFGWRCSVKSVSVSVAQFTVLLLGAGALQDKPMSRRRGQQQLAQVQRRPLRLSAPHPPPVRRHARHPGEYRAVLPRLIRSFCAVPEQTQAVLFPRPPSRQRTPLERIIVAVTHNTENYVVDITGQTDAQAIRERIFSKFRIVLISLPSTAQSSAALRSAAPETTTSCSSTASTLATTAARLSSSPSAPMPPPTILMSPSCPPRMPSRLRCSPVNPRLRPAPCACRPCPVAQEALPPRATRSLTSPHLQTRSQIQTLHRQAASRRGRQPSSSSLIVRRQVRGCGCGTSDISPVAPYPQNSQQALPSQSSTPGRVSSPSSLMATRPNDRRGSVTPTPPATRSPPKRDANRFDDSAVASVFSVPAPNRARRPSEVDSAFERDLRRQRV
ncbi:hypothetical protein FRC12_004558 [Ceratobasidium sp. 428]|nr:hypothetical protein FRC12_004558 [Ceratobasidium sp. 428]